MTESIRDPEHWRRFIAELESDLAAERVDEVVEWGPIDDETIALYIAGNCSPGVRAWVESAMLRHPGLRRLVRDLRRESTQPV
jgi:hypothetical protein